VRERLEQGLTPEQKQTLEQAKEKVQNEIKNRKGSN